MLRRPKQLTNKKQKGRAVKDYNVRTTQRLISFVRGAPIITEGGPLKEGGTLSIPSSMPSPSIRSTVKVAIVAKEPGEISAGQIYAMEYVLKRQLNKKASSYQAPILRLYPHRPRSKKPNEAGLGRGKGPINSWVTRIKKGHILIQFTCEDKEKALRIHHLIRSKLPIQTRPILT